MDERLRLVMEAVERGEEEKIGALVEGAVEGGLSPVSILERGMMPAMDAIGARFSRGEAFIPELIVSAMAMESGLEALRPHLGEGDKAGEKVLLGTVQGDIHSIGKNLVRMCLEGGGFEVIDIGEDVKTERFLEAYLEHRPAVVGLSALLSSTMQRMTEVAEALREADPGAVVMVGGAPVTPEFAKTMEAEYAPDAFGAVELARDLTGRKR